MNTKSIFPALSITFLLAALLACNLGSPTNPPEAPTQTLTAEANSSGLTPDTQTATPDTSIPNQPATQNNLAVSYAGINFTIPEGLATGATPQVVAEVADQGGPTWDVAPEHTTFLLENYPLQGTMHKPMIYVFPGQKYADVNPAAAESIKRLRALTSGAGMGVDNQTLPYVPFFNATQTFEAQAMPLHFNIGDGWRFITQYDQAPIPANNHELIYHFEGLVSNTDVYVIAIFPINSSLLAADDNPNSPVPPGGVPFDMNNPQAYFETVTQTMNQAAPESFSPSLAQLDALITSLGIVAP